MSRPRLVVIEGIDRVGKNTQAALLAARLAERGVPVSRFTTPDYETPTGRVLHDYLRGDLCVVSSHDLQMSEQPGERLREASALVLQSLMLANRGEVAARVKSALARGEWAVCVRWWPSAMLYGAADGLDLRWVRGACSLLPEPDLLVLLDAPADFVADRLDHGSRYESLPRQRELAAAYRALWRDKMSSPDQARWTAVPADLGTARVAELAWSAVLAMPDLGDIP